jgi:hypothetical protein
LRHFSTPTMLTLFLTPDAAYTAKRLNVADGLKLINPALFCCEENLSDGLPSPKSLSDL